MLGPIMGQLGGGAGAGAGEEELTDLKFIGGDSDSTWKERQRIHADAVAMCNNERNAFGDAINAIAENAGSFSTRDTVKD